jgi:hypothetical protein
MSRTSRLTIRAVSEAGIKEADVKLRYKVVTRILSARGSRKLPSIEAWPGNVLAIHPSSYNNSFSQYSLKAKDRKISTKSVKPATPNMAKAVLRSPVVMRCARYGAVAILPTQRALGTVRMGSFDGFPVLTLTMQDRFRTSVGSSKDFCVALVVNNEKLL